MTVKSKKLKPKLSQKTATIPQDDFLTISFRYLTSSKQFNFNKMDKGQKREWESELMERLIELTKHNWIYWEQLPKNQGYETLKFKYLNLSPTDYLFSEDEKVIIFRFNKQIGRIIGFKNNNNPTFYIIGIDTDFSAYDHGS